MRFILGRDHSFARPNASKQEDRFVEQIATNLENSSRRMELVQRLHL